MRYLCMPEISKSDRLRRLLEAGFYPDNIPPPFVSADYAKYRSFLASQWNGKEFEKKISFGEPYSVPRFGKARRNYYIPNPVSYFKLAKFIADNWISIRAFLRKSEISTFRPVFDKIGQRTFFPIDFGEIEEKKTDLLALHDCYLKTDISRYYPGIYTHTIPWAMHGKQWCKQNLNTPALKNSIGGKLDKYVRHTQGNQSVGIPIGPETSRVIGEIIGTGLDCILQSQQNFNRDNAFRYVDDMFLGYNDTSSFDSTLRSIADAASTFELDLNYEKTSQVNSTTNDGDWVHKIREFTISPSIDRQKYSIRSYFQVVQHESLSNPKENVLHYALRRAVDFAVHPKNWFLFENYLFRSGRQNHTCIPAIVEILVDRNYEVGDVNKNRVVRFIEDTISKCVSIKAAWELSWLLFLAKALRIRLEAKVIERICSVESSVCALLLLDLKRLNLADSLNAAVWDEALRASGPYGPMWLLLYEGSRRNWISSQFRVDVEKDEFLRNLIQKNMQFYSTERNLKNFKARKRLRLTLYRRRRFVMENIDRYI